MKKLVNHTVQQYVTRLSRKEPAPGGGSAAALAGALGAGLVSMATHYSVGKGASKVVETRLKSIIKKAKTIQDRLLVLVDLDAQAYDNLVKAKKLSKAEYNKALRVANNIPKEIIKLTGQGVELTSYLAEHGNKWLLADVEAAAHHFMAASNSARAMIEANA